MGFLNKAAVAFIAVLSVSAQIAMPAAAQAIPGAADVTRLQNDFEKGDKLPQKPETAPPVATPQSALPPKEAVPENAEDLTFTLRGIELEGVSVYKPHELEALWRNDIGKTVSLKQVYDIAAAITAKYRADGYFLSSAYVPAQEIKDGPVRISVVEGYIQEVQLTGNMPSSFLLEQLKKRLLALGPLNIKMLERQMLLLNDLPGTHFRAVLKALQNSAETPAPDAAPSAPSDSAAAQPPQNSDGGDAMLSAAGPVVFPSRRDEPTSAVALRISGAGGNARPSLIIELGYRQSTDATKAPQDSAAQSLEAEPWVKAAAPVAPVAAPVKEGGVVLEIIGMAAASVHGSVSLDNSGSRFIGPFMTGAQISIDRGLPGFQQAVITLNTSVPAHELKSAIAKYIMPLMADSVKLYLSAGYTEGRPGFTLAPDNLVADSLTLGTEVSWDAVRQRTENLRLLAGLDYLDSRTDLLGLPFSHDRISAAKLGAHFDEQDRFNGSITADATLKQGLEIFGASRPGDPDLSRAAGRPDFTSLAATVYRFQNISADWNALLGATGQIADAPLLSSQQFGYGGQSFGRAYDTSELVGDQGVAAMAEIRYDGFKLKNDFHLQPFGFYDIGRVWNRATGLTPTDSGASAGLGLRLAKPKGISFSLTLAEPLTRKASPPQYGNGKSPRLTVSLGDVY